MDWQNGKLTELCDSLIMLARTRASLRGASPVQIERNVLKTDEPLDCDASSLDDAGVEDYSDLDREQTQ